MCNSLETISYVCRESKDHNYKRVRLCGIMIQGITTVTSCVSMYTCCDGCSEDNAFAEYIDVFGKYSN